MLAALGMFVFSLPTLAYEQLQRRAEWRHAANPRVGARDAHQFVGPGAETLSLTGTAAAELQDGAASIEDLRAMARDGAAWPLVDGTGVVHGSYVITGIDDRSLHLGIDGTARKIDFTIDLLLVDEAAA